MKKHYDVIIVGSRCAGSTLAIELGKANYNVLMLDQATFPSDTNSTHTFFNNTVHMLKELDVMSELENTSAPAIQRVLFQFDDIKIEGDLPPIYNEERSYCIPRKFFDQVMLNKATSFTTVTHIEGFRVKSLLKESDTVVGVEGTNQAGQILQFTAKLVVGADGRNSTIRDLLKLTPKQKVPTDFAFFYSYITDLEQSSPPKFEVYRIHDRTLVIFPTTEGQYVVFIAFPLTYKTWLKTFREKPQEAYLEFLKTNFPEIHLESRLTNATVVERVKGLIGFNNHWYPAMGKGWALVGDAAVFKDPGVAQGMHDAIYGGRALADVLKHHDWELQLEEMRELYEKKLEEKFSELFGLALTLTKNQLISVEQKMIQRIVSANPEATKQFLGMYNHANTIDEFNQTIVKIIQASGGSPKS
ncbi:NAD(P)/FAD-dependent oxidoreductase [Thermoflavimicrobium daqui]|uniref:FAD-binding protein n=1 Tax=Thermoflavimicrobium daqui TaxID=2137476 RepID=A0A364K4B4_9BACL|nr:NAD(P)/FAD-dependent oxidoreductase [Thermoflavimicrobium daqui]RAL24228.1 FAD-binding protein [Thermoflavimicrobium daqui]